MFPGAVEVAGARVTEEEARQIGGCSQVSSVWASVDESPGVTDWRTVEKGSHRVMTVTTPWRPALRPDTVGEGLYARCLRPPPYSASS